MRLLQIWSVTITLLAMITIPAMSQPAPGGRGGPPKAKGPREIKDRPDSLKVDWKEPPKGMIQNPRIMTKSTDVNIPAHYSLTGDVAWVWCGKADEDSESGIALYSGLDRNKDQQRSGMVTQRVTGFEGGVGKWFRFSIRGLAEPGFQVDHDDLFLRVDFYGKKGTTSLDGITQKIYPLIERTRKELNNNGIYFKNGGAVWKTYVLEFRLPFAEIDTLDVGVGFKNGTALTAKESEFYVTNFQLMPMPAPENAPKIVKTPKGPVPSLSSLIPLGGRWYYNPEPSLKERPETLVVTAKNADRLFYMDGKLSNPFAENMTAWLRKGHLDLKGNEVPEDRFLPDNVVLEFKNGKELIVHARNIPNHPTAIFPSRRTNPNSIQERDNTYYLPLEPVRNPKSIAMDKTNSNRALPMGAIGFATNGVCFFNPFDAGNEEAVNIMDRCCGHPSPDNQYHYHKYPVCVKTPFVDDGEEHSPLIGFALDGFPVYGPYVAKGLMARDDKDKPLDEFNMRFDEDRGWHYHVTPGKFPYIIGGFAGTLDPRNLRRGPLKK